MPPNGGELTKETGADPDVLATIPRGGAVPDTEILRLRRATPAPAHRRPSHPFPRWPTTSDEEVSATWYRQRWPDGDGGRLSLTGNVDECKVDPLGKGRPRRGRGHRTPLPPAPTAAKACRIGEEVQLQGRAPAQRRRRPLAAGSIPTTLPCKVPVDENVELPAAAPGEQSTSVEPTGIRPAAPSHVAAVRLMPGGILSVDVGEHLPLCCRFLSPLRVTTINFCHQRPTWPPTSASCTARFLNAHLSLTRVRRPSGDNCNSQAAAVDTTLRLPEGVTVAEVPVARASSSTGSATILRLIQRQKRPG